MTITALPQVDHLTAKNVAELVQMAAWPAVTILLDTTPADRMSIADAARLQELVVEAERQLTARSAWGGQRLSRELRTLAELAAAEPTGYGLALFVSRAVQRCYRLPEPLEPVVVVEETFRTRDLLQSLHRTPPHLLLVVHSTCAQLYRAHADTLVPVPSHGFPAQLAVPTLGRLATGRPESDDDVLGEFLHTVDRQLAKVRRRLPAPLIVAGDPEPVGRLLRRGHSLHRLAGVLTGLDIADPVSLHTAARAALDEYLGSRQAEALEVLEEARRTQPDDIVFGVENAWQAVARGVKPVMLVVEESYRFPAVVDDDGVRHLDWVRTPEAAPPGTHTDLVDDLIEVVIDRGGWVAFADDGRLGNLRHLALVTASQ